MDDGFKIEARPPELIDRVVHWLTPPLAREALLGDLWERYQSPAGYLFEALQTLPFVILSQIRRSARGSLLGLQAFILLACFGGFETSGRMASHPAQAIVPTLAALLASILRDAYRRRDQRTFHRAVLDTLWAAVGIAASEVTLFALTMTGVLGPGWVLPLPQLALGILALPILFVLRSGTSLEETTSTQLDDALSARELADDYRQFRCHVNWRNRAETAALGILATGSVWYLLRFNPPVARFGWVTLLITALLALYLAMKGSAPPAHAQLGFNSLRANYRTQLLRQCRLRNLMWWFWLTPLFLGLIIKWVARGYLQNQPLLALSGVGLALLLAACLAHLNHGRARQVQRRVQLLAALRERYAP